ncbi:acylphosphatase [Oceanobacillus oncorhynchi subsp. oncorhynchi]|uniref:ATP-binding protein n=1 Tax=Oceanobacillus oncorhynchi TaxID=545501 RepID=UPI0036391F98
MAMNNFPQNLTPDMVEGINGFNLCTFLIGLEGWRRGLTLTFHNKIDEKIDFGPTRLSYIGRLLSLSDNESTHYFFQSRGDTTNREAVKIARDKGSTKSYLKQSGVPVLESFHFTKDTTNQEIITKAEEIGYPVIIKPTNGTLSQGVVINIINKSHLEESLIKVREKLGYKSIILERYFEGDDIRTYVIDGKIVAGLKRVPAKITGDGKHTIQELIDLKNDSRKDNPYLSARAIKINKETHTVLQKQGYTVEDILEESKTILIKNKSTLAQGVDLYDITEELTDQVKEIAINTIDAIPGMTHASIDMLTDGTNTYVLEVNSSANISMHMFPTEGEPRNVPAFLVDYYFPDSIPDRDNNQNMSYDYLDITDTLRMNYTDFIQLRPLENKNIFAKEISIKGTGLDANFEKFVRRKALSKRLNGHIKRIDDNEISVVVASYAELEIKQFLKAIKKYNKTDFSISSFQTADWKKSIKIGFFTEG